MLAMTCRELADFLMDYLSEELPAGVREDFDRHLALCPNCVAYLETYRTAVEAGRRAFDEDGSDPETAVPDELVRAILAASKGEPTA
jgi:anti-sigma factor RsiW